MFWRIFLMWDIGIGIMNFIMLMLISSAALKKFQETHPDKEIIKSPLIVRIKNLLKYLFSMMIPIWNVVTLVIYTFHGDEIIERAVIALDGMCKQKGNENEADF